MKNLKTFESFNEAKYNDWDKSRERVYTDALVDNEYWFPELDAQNKKWHNPKLVKTWYDRIERYDYKGLATFIRSKGDTKHLAQIIGNEAMKDLEDFAKFIIMHV